jgi:hypothetical protein
MWGKAEEPATRTRTTAILAALLLVASWYAMLALHELGHIVHALMTGATGIRLVFPVLGFSKTDVASNPHPLAVACGGVLWGSLLPLLFWMGAKLCRWRYAPLRRFLAGFCLLANGGYLLSAAFNAVGDVEEMIRSGGAQWLLTGCGLAGIAAGVLVWHRLRPLLMALVPDKAGPMSPRT